MYLYYLFWPNHMAVRLSDISSKTAQKHKKGFFACFIAYVGQPHSHMGRATSMPFTSINSTNPRTNPWNFHEKILRIGGAEKWGFFESPFRFFFGFISMKTSSPFIWGIIYFCNMDGFLRILEKTSSELICTWLYLHNFLSEFTMANFQF